MPKRRTQQDPDLQRAIAFEDPDLYAFVERRAGEVVRKLSLFEGDFSNAFDRMIALASLEGYVVKPMDHDKALRETRDAVLMATPSEGRKGIILYNPWKPQSRVVYTIAHEITHSFFPNSRAGAQFRSAQRNDGPPPELERLCDIGAAVLCMPTSAFRAVAGHAQPTLAVVDDLRREFGTSFEATAYRVATAAAEPVAVARFCFRRTKAQTGRARNGQLFPEEEIASETSKYRRQSFHASPSYPKDLVFPWNKSLPEQSVAYTARESTGLVSATEILAPRTRAIAPFRVEAIVAPYQRGDAAHEWPDILVLLALKRD